MSVESQQLERSALESKDRDELQTIAVALGGKPGSRAKKADIVDLILELAGVTSAAPATAAPADAAAEDDKPVKPKRTRRAKAAPAPVAEELPLTAAVDDLAPSAAAEPAEVIASTDEAAAGVASVDDASADEASTHEAPNHEVSVEDDSDEPDDDFNSNRPTESRDNRDQSSRDGRRDQGRQGRNGNGNGNGNQGNQAAQQNQGNQQAQPNQQNQGNQSNQGNQQNQGDDLDGGNRRRRRRGRDRDRGDRPDEQWQGDPVEVEGLLDLRDEGYGFLRLKGYLPTKDDVYVSVKQVRQFSLRKGDHVKGTGRPAGRSEKNPALLKIDAVNGGDPDKMAARPNFDDLTPLFPDDKLQLEVPGETANMTARIVDLIAPIGKGQRGLIVSPPKAGKTTIMKQIARSIEKNHPDVHLIVLLVDERPEEVTDMKRHLTNGEVAASTFDRPTEEHTMVSELVIERAKRLVEEGKDVVIILDGITRLARAYNLAAPATGRVMSGGIDTGALYPPKKFFGAARNVEEGGSLTILATALVETGSKMDEVIFEEFKGTGNMELRLDRRLAERRIYPAIDVDGSSTRHEELLFDRKQLQQVWKLRRVLSAMDGGNGAGLEMLIDRLSSFKSNDAFLTEVAKTPVAGS